DKKEICLSAVAMKHVGLRRVKTVPMVLGQSGLGALEWHGFLAFRGFRLLAFRGFWAWQFTCKRLGARVRKGVFENLDRCGSDPRRDRSSDAQRKRLRRRGL